MTQTTEISVVRTSTDRAIRFLGSAGHVVGLAPRLVVIPTETEDAVSTLLEVVSLLLLGQCPPLWTVHKPGAGIGLTLEVKCVILVAALAASILGLHPLQPLLRSLS